MTKDKSEADLILVDYYPGAYGPTLRMDVRSAACLSNLRDLMSSLSSGELQKAQVHDIDFFRLSGVDRFTLMLVDRRAASEKSLEMVAREQGKVEFVWALDKCGWDRCVGLIEGLMEKYEAGHQYLTEEGLDDALIELSFREALE